MPTPRPTERRELDQALQRLGSEARSFARLEPQKKAELLEQTRALFFELSAEMVHLGNRAKGIDPRSSEAGEEWFGGPCISLRALRLFARSLLEVSRYGAPQIPAANVERADDGRWRVVLTPADNYDRALFRGWQCRAWLRPGIAPARIADVQASFYRKRDAEGRLVLVLGAGNVGSISVLDLLYHSFVEGAVCLLKMSPVNAYLGPLYERAFAPLIERGYLSIAYGDASLGSYLTQHPAVDAIHVTGSAATHDNIVWGATGPEREQRRRERRPLTQKRITSELGNVSPVLIVPAAYSDRELDAAARSLAGMVVHNASFNCNAAKMLVTSRRWPQRAELLDRLGRVLSNTKTRVAYYPGAHDRYQSLLAATEGKIQGFGECGADALPWTLVSDLNPNSQSSLFGTEPFCSIFAETSLDVTDAEEFLASAVSFVNERLWGTLNAMLIVPDEVERDPTLNTALEHAIEALRYGTVSVNLWPAVAYGLALPPWGGFPGATPEDVQSGIGWSHNAWLLDEAEKTVLRGPLLGFPQPFWYPGHAHLPELGRALAAIEAEPSLPRVVRAAWAAARPRASLWGGGIVRKQ